MKQNYDDNELDGLFRDKLAGEEVPPREMVWDKIEQQLDGAARKPGGWIWWVSGIVLVMGIGTWLGISMYQKNALVQNSKVTGWNYNDATKSDFTPIQQDGSSNGDSVVTVEGGKNTAASANVKTGANEVNDAASANVSNAKNSNSTTDNSSSKKTLAKNSSDNSSATQQSSNANSTNTQKTSADKNTVSNSNAGKNHSQKKPSLAKSDINSSSIYSDKPTFEKNYSPDKASGLVITHSDSPDKNASASDSGKDARGSSRDGSVYSLPKKLGEFNKPIDTANAKLPLSLTENKGADSSNAKQLPTIVDKDPTTLLSDVPADSVAAKKELAKNDSIAKWKQDSIVLANMLAPTPLPIFYFALHGGVDAGKILSVTESYEHDEFTDVRIYDKDDLKALPQQSYSYGGRFGWFLSKRISLTAGAYYSIFQTAPQEGHFRYNHNYPCVFTMYSATSSVKCKSSNFDWSDNSGTPNDTFNIQIQSQERYDYVNLQLGVSYYALRTKHFGVYADVLSNGAYLAKQSMTLTVPKSGKTLQYGADWMTGMNKFVMGGQVGVGAEFIVGGHFGLWAEPSFYFSGALNRKNAVNLQPGGMRYLVGLAYHF